MTATQTVIDAIRGVTFGPETRFENLTMVPIVGDADRRPEYLTLDEALAEGCAELPRSATPDKYPG